MKTANIKAKLEAGESLNATKIIIELLCDILDALQKRDVLSLKTRKETSLEL